MFHVFNNKTIKLDKEKSILEATNIFKQINLSLWLSHGEKSKMDDTAQDN